MKELFSIVEKFNIEGEVESCEKYGNGHINDTYLVVCKPYHRYIMQRINTSIFCDVENLMKNIYLVTSFLGKEAEYHQTNSASLFVHKRPTLKIRRPSFR